MDTVFAAQSLKFAQTKKGCIQEACGCEANTEIKIISGGVHIATAEEQSSCLIRFCCKGNRPWDTKVVLGTAVTPELEGFLSIVRPFRCPAGNFKCCCYQEVSATAGGAAIGKVVEKFYICVPLFEVQGADGLAKYELQMPTCLGGMCVDIMKEGLCNCKIPYYIYAPGKRGDGEELGKIVKIWGGFGKELFTDADTFEFEAPEKATVGDKALFFAATMLINQLYFEGQKDVPGIGGAPLTETMER